MSFKARFQPHRGFLFFFVLSVTNPKPPRMMSSSANYRPFLSSFRHIPPQASFVQLANLSIQTKMPAGEKGLCTYQRPSRGGDPGDIRGNSAGFADFCRQFLAQDRGIGPLLHYRGKIHGERPAGFVTSPPS